MSEPVIPSKKYDLQRSLDALIARVDVWREQRATIIEEIRTLNELSRKLLEELGTGPAAQSSVAVRARGRGGRPKGYRASAATRAKLREAWKRRKMESDVNPKR